MSTKSNLRCKVSDLVTLTAALLILPVGSTLAQEWTLDEDQLVKQPEAYSPFSTPGTSVPNIVSPILNQRDHPRTRLGCQIHMTAHSTKVTGISAHRCACSFG